MNTITNEDYKNILALINRVDLKGNEATTVAILIEKIKQQIVEIDPKTMSGTKEIDSNTNKDATI